MKKLLLFILVPFIFTQIQAQDTPADSGVFLLHKFEQHIGKETYKIYNYKDSKKYVVDFKFVDRGSPVPLQATLRVNPVADPIELFVKGNTSRFSVINDSIRIKGNVADMKVSDSTYKKTISGFTFPVTGYSPATVQQVLLQYWNNEKKRQV